VRIFVRFLSQQGLAVSFRKLKIISVTNLNRFISFQPMAAIKLVINPINAGIDWYCHLKLFQNRY
jgi:hypothetical protein